MKANSHFIMAAIGAERAYQDSKWGTISEHPHDIGAWLTIMRCELREAEEAWMKKGPNEALKEILQVISVGFACLQQHGVYLRDN